jgi:hypothetical protein
VSFAAQSAYPRTYTSSFRFIKDDGNQLVCKTCSFRPWASASDVVSAVVTVTRADGSTQTVAATKTDGRWVAPAALGAGDRAVIEAGSLRDANGETNGEPIVLAG